MKKFKAELILSDDDSDEGLDDPYWQLKDGGRVSDDDVRGADPLVTEDLLDVAFVVARLGEDELVQLDDGGDIIWLTTLDKVQKAKKSSKKAKRR